MSKNELDSGVNVGYIKDVKSGAIMSISGRGCIAEIEKQNMDLKRKGLDHLITKIVIQMPENEESKKAGRPKLVN